jgi:hypothetical protein
VDHQALPIRRPGVWRSSLRVGARGEGQFADGRAGVDGNVLTPSMWPTLIIVAIGIALTFALLEP